MRDLKIERSALEAIRTGLIAVQSFVGKGRHALDCNEDLDIPCDCGFIDPRETIEALITQLDELLAVPQRSITWPGYVEEEDECEW